MRSNMTSTTATNPRPLTGPNAGSDSCRVRLDLFKDMLRQRGYV